MCPEGDDEAPKVQSRMQHQEVDNHEDFASLVNALVPRDQEQPDPWSQRVDRVHAGGGEARGDRL